MTREEAIHHLYTYSTTMGSGQTSDEQHKEAKRIAIKALLQVTGKLNKCDDSLLTDDTETCKEQKSKLDLISRHDAIDVVNSLTYPSSVMDVKRKLIELPSAEPREYGVLCALADMECPFQGKEYAWCLTCPHISEEDRALVKKVASEPKTGKWKLDPNGMDWNIPAWRCSECGFVANYIGVEANGFGNNPMNWVGSKFCPQCGVRITGYER